MDDLVAELQDFRHLRWDERTTTSGTSGTFPKARAGEGRARRYYKLSCYDSYRGIYGHECVNELLAARVMEHLGIPHARYRLIHGLVVIDGGFCQAYHQTTGIAGYTLIADPFGMRIKAHRPFASIKDVLDLNADIMSDDDRFRRWPRPLTVGDTDDGVQIREQIADLRELLAAYRNGDITERAR